MSLAIIGIHLWQQRGLLRMRHKRDMIVHVSNNY